MDIYAAVTDRIIAELENGIIPWRKPWVSSGACVSHTSGKPYSLLNQILLGRPGEYVTFKQCQQEGGKIKKGAKAQIVVFWKWLEKEDEETGEKKEIPYLQYFNVFHIDQCEGLKAKHTQELPATVNPNQRAEEIISDYCAREGVHIEHEKGDRACYRPILDSVVLPLIEQFSEVAEYYSTAFHELTHSTGHSKRLNRLEKTAFFGTESYSREELVAEIGAATLVNHAGLETTESFRNSTAYIQNWLSVLKNDKRLIVSAAGRAEKAIRLILGLDIESKEE